jgi:hypothetical protein
MRGHLLYVITAQVLTSDAGFTGSRQVPTFYLDSATQCIISVAQAIAIARSILDPMGTLELSITAEPRTLSVAGN